MKQGSNIHYFFTAVCAAAILSLITDSTAADATSTKNHKQAAPTNIYGLSVIDESGNNRNFGQPEIKDLKPVASTTNQAAEASALTDNFRVDSSPGTKLSPTWAYPLLGSGLALNLWAGPTSEGKVEIYVGSGTLTFGSNQYWAALTYDAPTSTYQAIYASENYPSGIVELMVGDVTGNDRKEIVVLLSNGSVVVYDQLTKEKMQTLSTLASASAMRIANIDQAGKSEIVVCNGSSTAVYSDSQLQWTIAAGGSDLTVGQMDSDAGLEIALASGNVIDCDSRTIQWNRGSAFGVRLHCADIDKDGMDEVIAAESWYYVWAYDINTQFPKWSYKTDLDISTIALTDFDSDGNLEVAIGDGQWGDVYAIDPISHAIKYSIRNPEHSVAGIAVVDADGDGSKELIWGAGYSSTGQDILYVANPVTKAIEWQSVHLDGPIVGPEIGDLDGDGKDELVAASYESRSGYSSGRILVFDNQTLNLRAMSAPICTDRAWEGLNELKLRDMDQDGNLEIIIAADHLYDGVLEIYDFSPTNQFTMIWTNAARPSGSPFSAADVHDLDDDGTKEIVVGNNRSHTGSSGTYIRVYDYETKALEWTSFHLGGTWSGIADVGIADLDTTAGVEIAALLNGGNAFVFDGRTKEPKAIITGAFTSMKLVDKSIFLSDASGNLSKYAFDGSKYTETAKVSLGGPISGFNIVSANPVVLTYGSDGSLKFFAGGEVRAESVNYGIPYGGQFVDGATGGAFALGVHRHRSLPAQINPEPEVTTGSENIVSWQPAPGAIAFIVEADTDPAFTSPLSSGWVYDTSYEFTGLEYEPYYFRVKSLFIDGQTQSEWSEEVTSTQVPGITAAADWNLFI